MKVETDLRAGGIAEDLTSEANDFVSSINAFFADATAQAQNLVNDANSAATSVWNCLSNSLSR